MGGCARKETHVQETRRSVSRFCARVADTPVLIAIYVSLQSSAMRRDKGRRAAGGRFSVEAFRKKTRATVATSRSADAEAHRASQTSSCCCCCLLPRDFSPATIRESTLRRRLWSKSMPRNGATPSSVSDGTKRRTVLAL